MSEDNGPFERWVPQTVRSDRCVYTRLDTGGRCSRENNTNAVKINWGHQATGDNLTFLQVLESSSNQQPSLHSCTYDGVESKHARYNFFILLTILCHYMTAVKSSPTLIIKIHYLLILLGLKKILMINSNNKKKLIISLPQFIVHFLTPWNQTLEQKKIKITLWS